MTDTPTRKLRLAGTTATAVLGIALAGCVTVPASPPPPPPRAYTPPPQPAPDVYAYPLHDQPAEVQDRDHYECSRWATAQTGFDPAAPGVPAQQQVRVVRAGPPSGAGTAVGAVTGAILGAAISRPWQAATGALAGAVVGGAIGSATDAANTQQTRTVAVTDRRAAAQYAQQAGNYRRALSACLDGRGYSVR
ncbi:MAG: glycine zipper 2TM domain-containing protein [Proteobacteria bacterium]|nr:glycine zipper 2TM domain-containing protein [Pseudomonadota bacterium]